MMFWRMVQSGLQRWTEGQGGRDFLRTIWVSDGSAAARDLFTQRSAVYADGTAFIAGTIDLSDYLPGRRRQSLSAGSGLILRVELRFEQEFYAPPTVSLTGKTRMFGVKCLRERRFVPIVRTVTAKTCDIIVDLAHANDATDGLFVNWTAIGPSARFSGRIV